MYRRHEEVFFAEMPRRITAGALKKMDACEPAIKDFRLAFPNGAAITQENLVRAALAGLDLNWFSKRLRKHAAAFYNARMSEYHTDVPRGMKRNYGTGFLDFKVVRALALAAAIERS